MQTWVRFLQRAVPVIVLAVERLTSRRRRALRTARALSAVGQFNSGQTDISVEHDRELDEIYGS